MVNKEDATPYGLEFFNQAAQDEWFALPSAIRERFKNKLQERRQNPQVPKDRLRNYKEGYKIKITSPQIRLVYLVNEKKAVLTLTAISSRDDVYKMLAARMDKGKPENVGVKRG